MRDFNHSVNVLVNAYFDNTLEHGNCTRCAVGNLIDYHRKFSLEESHRLRHPLSYPADGWASVFCTFDEDYQRIDETNYHSNAKEQIDSTGYTWQELARVENAFEMSCKGENEDEWMFNGLMDVVDVLADIHGIDLEAKNEAKKLFVKA